MSKLIVFEGGPLDGRGDALAQVRDVQHALACDEAVEWHVDPSNLGLLSRTARALSAEGALRQLARLTVILAAVDESPTRTVVAYEGELVPTLRRLHGVGLPLRLSNGRPYVLPPPALDLSTNNLCGLACVMCDNRATTRDPQALLPAEVRTLLVEAAAWGIRRVSLTGAGEPFRDPEMLGYIQAANDLGHGVAVTSNGFPIAERTAAELAARTVSVSLSIHGSTPTTHEAIVGVPTAGERAFGAVRRLVAARDALAGKSKLSVNVSTVVQRANVTEVAALARWALEAGCDGFNVQPINLQHGSIRGDKIARRDDRLRMDSQWPLPLQAGELDRLVDELRAVGQQKPGFLHASDERLHLLRRYFTSPTREALGVSCRVGDTFIAVDHRGAIKPCYRLPWTHGDARLVDIRRLWNSPAYAQTRVAIDSCPLTCLNNCYFRERRPT